MLKPKTSARVSTKQIISDSGRGNYENCIESKVATSETNCLERILSDPKQEYGIEKPMILAEVQIQENSLENLFRIYNFPSYLK